MQVLKELQEESLKARSGIAGGNPGGNPGGPSAGGGGGGGGGSGGLAAGSKGSGSGKASGGVFGAAGWGAASQGARGSGGASDPMSKEWRRVDDLEKHIGNLQRFAHWARCLSRAPLCSMVDLFQTNVRLRGTRHQLCVDVYRQGPTPNWLWLPSGSCSFTVCIHHMPLPAPRHPILKHQHTCAGGRGSRSLWCASSTAACWSALPR